MFSARGYAYGAYPRAPLGDFAPVACLRRLASSGAAGSAHALNSRSARAFALALSLLWVALPGRPARGQTINEQLWGTDGPVTALAVADSTLYIGGSFSFVGPVNGGGVPVASDGSAALHYPKVNGPVLAAVSDGAGGWFIGGEFTGVGGVPRTNLAHILADGSVGAVRPDPDAPVTALALSAGTLYVGGNFTHLSGQVRSHVAALNAETGELTPWDPDAEGTVYLGSGFVSAFVVGEETVYLAGNFTRIGGADRSCLAEVDRQNGFATAWRADADNYVLALVRVGNTIYAGGYFTHIAGSERSALAALDQRSGTVLPWNPGLQADPVLGVPQPYILALAPRGEDVYVGGHFNQIGGEARQALAAIDRRSGRVSPWHPEIAGGYPFPEVAAIALSGQDVTVGGAFSQVDGSERSNAAKVDGRTGAVESWNPRANNTVRAIASDGGKAYLGGTFSMLGNWQPRHGLAALDLHTGKATAWDPSPDGTSIFAVTAVGQTLYVGGDFSTVGGQLRPGLAALDALCGQAAAWNPGANGAARVIVQHDSLLYVGGSFTQLGGQPRRHVAALGLSTALASGWDPISNDDVWALVISDSVVYAGGYFSRIGGQFRNYMAALDARTGGATAWNPNPDLWVNTLLLDDATLYVGGAFDLIAGEPRVALAALDVTSGQLSDWRPDPVGAAPYPEVDGVAMSGETVYATGNFMTVGGAERDFVAALDPRSGTATSWQANLNGRAWCLVAAESTIYVGGRFSRAGLLPAANIAAISAAQLLRPRLASPSPSSVRPSLPTPPANTLCFTASTSVRGAAVLHFTLPQAMVTSISVFDLQGRRVTSPLNHELEPAGEHEVALQTRGWLPGCYLCRLEVGSSSLTRKLLVVR